MRDCEIGDLLVSAYSERRWLTASKKEVVDAMLMILSGVKDYLWRESVCVCVEGLNYSGFVVDITSLGMMREKSLIYVRGDPSSLYMGRSD